MGTSSSKDLTWSTKYKCPSPTLDDLPITKDQPDLVTQQTTVNIRQDYFQQDIAAHATELEANKENYRKYIEVYIPKALSVLRDKLDCVTRQRQYAVEPWFEWNAVDLSQFGAPLVGSNVTSHIEEIVSYGGFKWIRMRVTATVSTSGIRNGVILPIEVLPPSADYVIAFDFVNIAAASNVVGAAAVVRLIDQNTAYYCRYSNRSSGTIQDFGRFDPTYVMTRFQDMNDPYLEGYDRGCRMALSVQGGSPGSAGALVKMIVGEPALYIDTSPHTAVGKAGLFQTTSAVAGTTENYFRNIRCYRASEVEQFEL